MQRGDIHELRPPSRGGHERAGKRFGVIVQANALLPRSVVLLAPTSQSAGAASFRPVVRVNGNATRCPRRAGRRRRRESTGNAGRTCVDRGALGNRRRSDDGARTQVAACPSSPARLQRLDTAPRSRCICQTSVGGDQDAVDRLCQGDVASVVRSEVRAKFPHSSEKWRRRKHRDREDEEVTDGGVRLLCSQLTPVGVSPDDRCDLDPQEIWAGDRRSAEAVPESPPIVPRVGECRGED